MSNLTTPALLEQLEVLKTAPDPIPNILGKFDKWPTDKPDPTRRPLSEITKEDLTALGGFTVQIVSAYIFRGKELNHPEFDIIGDILKSQTQPIMQRLDVSDNLVGEVQTSVRKGRAHSLTYDKSEMTRRSVVDAILSAAVSLAETAWDFAVLNAEEYNYSTQQNTNLGVTFVNPVDKKTYILSGPIDYVVIGLNSTVVAQRIRDKRIQPYLVPSEVYAAIQGSDHRVCPIEAKASISIVGGKRGPALRQVIGESLVVARYKDRLIPFPFILSDGLTWNFGILLGKEVYTVDLLWDSDHVKDILRAIVIWTCSDPQLIWNAMKITNDKKHFYGPQTL
ncbi:hypothetical protein B0H19DRAFT_1268162 [Mycena capillaripes]|nr:hypothetical protein B0H19DRAFT_1268162 [Mycena capillaripes]